MRKALRITGIVGAALLGLVLLVLAALPFVLNSKVVTRTVDRLAAQYIDGELTYDRIRISPYRHFPRMSVTLEGVAVTYPHERFAQWDLPEGNRLLEAGRGPLRDTLVRFRSLSVSADALAFLRLREIRAKELTLDAPAAFAHDYGDAANWDILRIPHSEKKKELDLPWIRLGELHIGGRPTLVYTAQHKDTYAAARWQDLTMGGDVHVTPKRLRIKDFHLGLDSLRVFGHIPSDTLSFHLSQLRLDEQGASQTFDAFLRSEALVRTQAFGRLDVPLQMDARFSYDQHPERLELGLERLDALIARLPLHAEGEATVLPERIDLQARADVTDCPLDTLLRCYLDRYLELSRNLETDARLNLGVQADGSYAKDRFPHVTAQLRIPQSHTHYRPMRLDADLLLDADAEMSPEKRVNARVRQLHARIPGLDANASGSASDLLGANPRFQLQARAKALLRPLLRFIPAKLGINDASGDVDLQLKAGVSKRELQTYQFDRADVSGLLLSDSLQIHRDGDSLDARLYRSRVQLGSNQAGLRVNADFDSLYLDRGVMLQTRVRDMRNGAQLIKVPSQGQMVPRIFVSTSAGRLFAKKGSSRMGVSDASVWAAAEERVRPEPSERMRHILDSLQERYPDTPRSDLLAQYFERERVRRSPGDFADKDINIVLDTSITRLLRRWSPSGSVLVDNGFFASPRLPLRTRLNAFSAGFDDDEFDIDTLSITSGSSDVQATGYVQGLRALLTRRGTPEAQLNLESSHLNLNELLAALEMGKADIGTVEAVDEQDESFVTDTLSDAVVNRIPFFVVPGNIKATMGVVADTVDYAELQVGPVLAVARVQDRTAQLLGAHAFSDFGNIGLDAYYSTRSKEDISTGVDLQLSRMDAEHILNILPNAEELMPALRSFKGMLSCELSATAQLDTAMNVQIPSLDGLLRISGHDMEITDVGDKMRRYTRLLLFRNKNIGHIDDLSVDAVIHDSKIEVFPFQLGVDRYKFALRGTQGFDSSLYYHVSVLRSPIPFRFGLNLYGTMDDWRVSLGRARYQEGNVPVYTQELDAVQLNINRGIRDIFNTGVDRVRSYNAERAGAEASSAGTSRAQDDDALSSDELQTIDDFAFEAELEEQQAALDEELNSALELASSETDRLLAAYTEQAYDKRILRKMEKMKKSKQ